LKFCPSLKIENQSFGEQLGELDGENSFGSPQSHLIIKAAISSFKSSSFS